jgi:hypothetical protein
MVSRGVDWARAAKCVVERALREGLHRRQLLAVLTISVRVEGIKRAIMVEY